jgi:hypothetical protein
MTENPSSDYAPVFCHGLQLFIRQIAGMIVHSRCIWVSDDNWGVADFQSIEEAAIGQMRESHQHAEPVHLLYHRHSELRQTPSGAAIVQAVSQFAAAVVGKLHTEHAETTGAAQ